MRRIASRAESLAKRLDPYKRLMGKLTLTFGIGMVTIGFPSQIIANWRAGECKIDIVLITVALLLYLVRIPYQVSARAWYLLPADILGLAASIILFAQWLAY